MWRRFEPQLLTGLLELTAKSSESEIGDLAVKSGLTAQLTEKILANTPEVRLEGARVFVAQERRVQLAVKAVKSGADRLKVARLLTWRDFEIFSAQVFSAFGYETATNVRLKSRKGRVEIDLVGQRYSNLVAVDCKHWKNVLSGKSLAKVVERQVLRAERLAQFLTDHWGPGDVCVRVLPVVLCLYESRERFFNGCPLVSATNLPSFAEQLPVEIAELKTHKAEVSRVPDIGEIRKALIGMKNQRTLR